MGNLARLPTCNNRPGHEIPDTPDSAASANASALNATQQATSAQSSATAAKTSETKAQASEGAAKTSETKAQASEANAKVSEQAAKESATSAQNSAKSAADSVTKINSAAVLTAPQSLTPDQTAQARNNIDAVSQSELENALKELIVEYGGVVPA